MVYLDIIHLCTDFKVLLQSQKKSSVKRIFQPLSPALNAQLENSILRFRQHRKALEKEAGLCHMIEEKESRDLVLRNAEAAKARERGLLQHASFIVPRYLIDSRGETKEYDISTMEGKIRIQAPQNAKDTTPWNWFMV